MYNIYPSSRCSSSLLQTDSSIMHMIKLALLVLCNFAVSLATGGYSSFSLDSPHHGNYHYGYGGEQLEEHGGTSLANFNLKSYGSYPVVVHSGHGAIEGGYGAAGSSYAEGYGHGGTSSANFNLKSYGSYPVVHSGHGVIEGGYGAAGSSYAEGYGHGGTSSANFHLKSYGSYPVTVHSAHYGHVATEGGHEAEIYGHGGISSANYNLLSLHGHGYGH